MLFGLFFFGFGVKAGVIPLHVWLPEAHPAAPSSISALMSAVLIKAGIYGLFRFCAFGLGTPAVAWGLTFVGVRHALGDSRRALRPDAERPEAAAGLQHDRERGNHSPRARRRDDDAGDGPTELAVVAIAASLYHVMNHAAFKGLLFLGAGSVVMATGTRQIEAMGGLLRRMPWTGAFFLVGALAISGVPPLNGFASEWLTFQALLLGFEFVPGLTRVNFPLAGALLALTSALAAVCFVKAFGITFLALPRSAAAAEARESPATMLVPLALLAVLCLALGLFPGLVLMVLGRVTASLPGLTPSSDLSRGALTMASGSGPFAQVTPAALGLALVGGLCSGGASRRCDSRDACHPTGADVGLRRHAERAHRIHGDRVLEAALLMSSARCIARRARSRRWPTCRRISRPRFATALRSSRRSSAISMTRSSRRHATRRADEGAASRQSPCVSRIRPAARCRAADLAGRPVDVGRDPSSARGCGAPGRGAVGRGATPPGRHQEDEGDDADAQGTAASAGGYDLAKLLRKETVRSETASWVYVLGPRLYFAAAVAATTLVPVLVAASPLEGAGGILGLVGILALGRFALAAAASIPAARSEGWAAAAR